MATARDLARRYGPRRIALVAFVAIVAVAATPIVQYPFIVLFEAAGLTGTAASLVVLHLCPALIVALGPGITVAEFGPRRDAGGVAAVVAALALAVSFWMVPL